MEDDEEGEDEEGPIEVFGVHRLQLAPGTKSGYTGVRPCKSKKNPWQAWLSLKGVAVPDEVMVALTEHRISLLLDHHTGQLVQPGQLAATIVISTVLSVDLKLASAATESDPRELESRGSPRARPLHEIGLSTTC